jgi:hypothetical protein
MYSMYSFMFHKKNRLTCAKWEFQVPENGVLYYIRHDKAIFCGDIPLAKERPYILVTSKKSVHEMAILARWDFWVKN